MKAFLGTVLVLGVAAIAFLAFKLFAPNYIVNEVVLLSGLCNTEPLEVKDPEGFVRCLKRDGIDQSHYKIRLRFKAKGSDPRDIDAGTATPCSQLNWGGAQITQHIHLTREEIERFAKCRISSNTSSANPSPTPAP